MSRSERRAASWKMGCAGLAAAAVVSLGAAREARADAASYALVGTGIGLLGADIAFAANGLSGAVNGRLDRNDGWLVAQTVVTAPQTALFNALIFGFNTGDGRQQGDMASLFGVVPTISVSALTTHAIWGLADGSETVPADALAGVSVLVGANVALTSGTVGRAVGGKLHSRWMGIVEMIATAPGTAIGAYESSFKRDEQGAWIALTAWSGALFVHGLASAIADQTDESDWAAEEKSAAPSSSPSPSPSRPGSKLRLRSSSRVAGWTPPFVLSPTVVSDGVARVPGVMFSGVF